MNNVEWKEVENFCGQPANAQVFATQEDEQGNTEVLFGDAKEGARPPCGVNNIRATYRSGAGAVASDAGSLTVTFRRNRRGK